MNMQIYYAFDCKNNNMVENYKTEWYESAKSD